jgi:PqqD family protein of HPr-rel-A system
MSQASNLKNLAISETGFVFDPTSGATFTLNAAGLFVLQALRDGKRLDDVVQDLRESFDSVTVDAKDDVLDFVERLRQHGLLPRASDV